MKTKLNLFQNRRRAASGMTYAVVVGLVAVVAIVAVSRLGLGVSGLMTKVGNNLSSAGNTTAGVSAPIAPPALAASSYSLSNATLNANLTLPAATLATAVASGGTAPYTITAVSAGTACTGSISSGTITLFYTASSGACNFTVQDATSATASGTIGITLAPSCLALNTAFSSLTSGVYTIAPSTGQQTAYCDMSADGGGWTLVIRASGANLPANMASWDVSSAISPPATPSPSQTATFKYSDATINAIRGAGGIYRLQGDGFVTSKRFVAAYTYSHNTANGTQVAAAHISYPTTALSGGFAGTCNTGLHGFSDDQCGANMYFDTNYFMNCCSLGNVYWWLGTGSPPGNSCFASDTYQRTVYTSGVSTSNSITNCNYTMWVR